MQCASHAVLSLVFPGVAHVVLLGSVEHLAAAPERWTSGGCCGGGWQQSQGKGGSSGSCLVLCRTWVLWPHRQTYVKLPRSCAWVFCKVIF